MQRKSNALFSISEPRWADPEDSKKIKALKRRAYDLYVNFRGVFEKAAQPPRPALFRRNPKPRSAPACAHLYHRSVQAAGAAAGLLPIRRTLA